MKIQVEHTETTELEVSAPMFWVSKSSIDTKYLGWLDEKTVITIYCDADGGPAYMISLCGESVSTGAISRAYSSAQVISEEEFLTAHREALDSLSLIPKLLVK